MEKNEELDSFMNWLGYKFIEHDAASLDLIDVVFEYLSDQKMLTEKGEKLRDYFWKKYIKD